MATTNTWEVFLRCVPQPFTKLAKNSKARVAGASRHYSTSDRGDVTGGLSEKQGVGFKFLLFSPRKLGKIFNLTDIFPISVFVDGVGCQIPPVWCKKGQAARQILTLNASVKHQI